jgi:hypothetical protein
VDEHVHTPRASALHHGDVSLCLPVPAGAGRQGMHLLLGE